MFSVTYRPKNDRDHSRTELFSDIKDLGKLILNVTDNENEANSAMKWCNEASFGSKIIRQPNYKIECFSETQLQKDGEKVVKEICSKLGINYAFVGFDNDALTWDIDLDLSWIKLHPNYGYYCVINESLPDGTCKELFSTTNKNSQQFIKDVVAGVKRIVKAAKNTKASDNDWHRHYASGGNKKSGPNDYIDFYYKNNGPKIIVQYSDNRHNKKVAYIAYDASGQLLGTYPRIGPALLLF